MSTVYRNVPVRAGRHQGQCGTRRNRGLRRTTPIRSRSNGSPAAFRFRGWDGRSGSARRRLRPAAMGRSARRHGSGCFHEGAWRDPGRTDEGRKLFAPGGPSQFLRRRAGWFRQSLQEWRAESLPARTRANCSSVSSLCFQSPRRQLRTDGRGIPALFRSRRLRIEAPHRSQLYWSYRLFGKHRGVKWKILQISRSTPRGFRLMAGTWEAPRTFSG